MCTSATPHTYSLSVTGDSRVLADKDGWAARVLSSGSYVWQWHRYSYEGHTHTIAEITDLPDIADSIVLALNPNTYEITATIKKGNTTIATSAAIDLPLETMVVGGSYDDQTKKVVLTLKNGQTVEFSVADLVSGLAAENHTHSINDITDYTPPTITVDSALDATSENPVQNKVVKLALDSKAASSHTHTVSNITDFPTLGTAAALNVATSGNAANNEVVKGDDSRLPKADSNNFSGTMESGRTYRLTSAVSSLTVSAIEDGFFESNLIFTVSGNAFTLTLPQGTLIAGIKPEFANGITYIMSAFKGAVVFSVLTTYA
jgi:hypothetical protein